MRKKKRKEKQQIIYSFNVRNKRWLNIVRLLSVLTPSTKTIKSNPIFLFFLNKIFPNFNYQKTNTQTEELLPLLLLLLLHLRLFLLIISSSIATVSLQSCSEILKLQMLEMCFRFSFNRFQVSLISWWR